MNKYQHLEIEKKWQKNWEENQVFKTNLRSDKPPFYALDMFPYPSGAGLHVGHPEGYTATDIISRMKRMQGYEVLHPMGWDAFGLPAEQYALSTGNHPRPFNELNIDNFRRQIKSLGFSYDWSREINTTNPDYYKWTQWIFLKLYEHGYASLKDMPVNYCEECGTSLANEEVINGKCERKGHDVIIKDMRQWVLDIPAFADELLEDLKTLDWSDSLKKMQTNWIGHSTGADVDFKVEGHDITLTTYTTRCDTLFGLTHIVMAPEHDLVDILTTNEQKEAVLKFKEKISTVSEFDRSEVNNDESGVFTGSYAIHPITGKKLPIWLADYVLRSYGTGVVMAVPAHDDRDYRFAKKFDITPVQVLEGDLTQGAITTDAKHINSDFLDGLNIEDAKNAMIDYLVEKNIGKKTENYKIREWLFSRQRYWGEPFPVAYDKDGNILTIEYDQLPVQLPENIEIKPGPDGTSALGNAPEWYNVTINGLEAVRDLNTMPQWAGSCWYYIAYLLDPEDFKRPVGKVTKNEGTDEEYSYELIDPEIAKKWLPVDLYIGGAEHAVLHLLYARFWHKFLVKINVIDSSIKEPFQKLFNQGMILGEGNVKMSKSLGNVINPDDIVISHGADTLRLYEMFMGPLEASIAWSEDGLEGAHRFLDRVWRLFENCELVDECKKLDVIYHQTVKKVTEDYEKLSFNTAISQLMIFVNEANKVKTLSHEQAKGLLLLLNPIAPHITEEIWEVKLGMKDCMVFQQWPKFDENKMQESEIEIVIQINGKLKAKLKVASNISKDEQLKIAKEAVNKELTDVTIVKEIVVPQKLVNFVVKG